MMVPTMATKRQTIEDITQQLLAGGTYSDEKHRIAISNPDNDYEVVVCEIKADRMVAYSSTKADFSGSIAEFVADYFT